MAFGALIAMGFIAGFFLGLHVASSAYRLDAIKLGHAQWTVTPEGKAIWSWKTNVVEVGK